MNRVILSLFTVLILFACTQDEPASIRVESIKLDNEELELIEGGSISLVATILPKDAENQKVIWSSSNNNVVTVKDGEVTALSVGEAVITATSEDGGKKATCKVSVNAKPIPVTGISLDKKKARVFVNDELTLIATVAPEDATNKALIWTSSNVSVASVTNGVVKGVSVGETNISVKTEDGNYYATCVVSVTEQHQTQTKGPMTLDLGTVTSTTATFNGVLDIEMLGDYDMNGGGVGFIYAPADQPLNIVTSTKVQISEVDAQGKFTHTLTGLKYNSEYHYAIFVYKNTICQYGETQVFETVPIDIEFSVKDITQTRATMSGHLTLPESDKELEVGILYSIASDPTIATEGVKKVVVAEMMDTGGRFSYRAEGLLFDNSHYYRYYVKQGDTYTYGFVQNFKTEEVSFNLSISGTTQLTATFIGNVELTEKGVIEVGLLYSTEGNLTAGESGVTKKIVTPDSSGNISFKLDKLQYAVTYHYCYYLYQNGQYTYGPTQTFTTSPVSINISVGSITQTTAQFSGKVGQLTEENAINMGVLYTTGIDLDVANSNVTRRSITPDESGTLSFKATNLQYDKTYRYCYYTYQNGQYTYGPTQTFNTAPLEFDLSISSVSMTSVTVNGNVVLTEKGAIEVGVIYYDGGPSPLTHASALGDMKLAPDSMSKISSTITGLHNNKYYYLCFYTCQNGVYRYDGQVHQFKTSFGELLGIDVTQTTATFNGKINRTNGEAMRFDVGVKYSTDSDLTKESVLKRYFTQHEDNLSCIVTGLQHGTTYYCCYFVHDKEKNKTTYGETQTFTTTLVDKMNLSVDSITQTTAVFNGNVELTEDGVIEVGVLYSTGSNLTNGASGVTKHLLAPNDSGVLSFKAEGLQYGTTYNYCYYIYQKGKYTYGTTQNFTTLSPNMTLNVNSVTQTTAVFNGNVELTEDGVIEVGVLYSTGSNLTNGASGVTEQVLTPDLSGVVSFKAEDLQNSTTYNYRYYVCQNGKYKYGPLQNFKTQSVAVNLFVESVTQTTAVFKGNVGFTEDGVLEVGVLYSTGSNLTNGASGVMKQVLTPDSSGMLLFKAEGLFFESDYNYCYYVFQNEKYIYGASQSFTTATLDMEGVLSLTEGSTANCYIVPQSGIYKIETVKGNSRVSVGSVTSADVLWESFGTNTAPYIGQLVGKVKYKDEYIVFQTAETFKEGNAVIAANDADGNILWSWHIWLTEQPQGQAYKNNVGTMMDRNLGATSATPGDVGALGLLYQWGRKDPFLGSSSISDDFQAEATIPFPSKVVSSDSSTGTIAYATANPTTFITSNSNNYDWYYTGSSSTDNTRWTTSSSDKSIYDPCPAGWRVPDVIVWSNAEFDHTLYDSLNKGISFRISSPSTTWYPATGYHSGSNLLRYVGRYGNYWSASPNRGFLPYVAYSLVFHDDGHVSTECVSFGRADGLSVRCIKE